MTYELRVLRVLRYIHENPSGDLSLDALADVATMSRFHWHRVFQAMTGETCAQAVRRIRLYRAATWLVNSDAPVLVIAARVGYPNVQSFSRAFSERFGVPPARYRRAGRVGLPPQQRSRGTFIMFKVDIKPVSGKRLAALSHRGNYNDIDQCFKELADTATVEKLWPRVQGMVAVHYDDPNVVGDADLRSHAGLVIADGESLPIALEELSLPAAESAVLHYKGPYTAIKVAYDYLYGEWLPNSGREPADLPPYEVYLNDPADTRESELLTDIVLPLGALINSAHS